MSQECLIIDDLDEALARMSALGRAMAQRGVDELRAAAKEYAVRRGWSVVSHSTFATWVSEWIARDPRPWFALDPLFTGPPDAATRHLRFSRRHDADRGVTLDGELPSAAHGCAACGVIDDAASSGLTLVRVLTQLSNAASDVNVVLLCASSRSARERIRAQFPATRLQEFVPGAWRSIHLRDGFSWLPFSGRPAGVPPIRTATRDVELRSSVVAQHGSLWQVLAMDKGVRGALAFAESDVVERLSRHLHRAARVEDIPLLGDLATAPAPLDRCMDSNAELSGFNFRPAS